MAEEIDVGMKCIKYMLFVANFMFVMIGFLLISIGSSIKGIYGDFDAFMAGHYFSPAFLAIAIGVIIFFVALFGCVGAIKESTLLINLFACFLAILLIMEISTAIAAYAMRGKIDRQIRSRMVSSMQNYEFSQYDQEIWDFTQQRLYCCGVDQPQDWLQSSHLSTPSPSDTISKTPFDEVEITTGIVESVSINALPWAGPSSCCNPRFGAIEECRPNEIFKDGCLDTLTYIVSESALLLGCGSLAVAFIQLLGIIFAAMLAKAVRRIKTQNLVEREEERDRNYKQLAKQSNNELPTPVLYTPTSSEA